MENVNSVCYINRINKITPIDGADKIEQATVNGWNSIVAKDVHKEGDLVLCITTDAVIPQELAEKWGVAQYLRKGNRVRTVKLKGVYSECILIPISGLEGIIKKEYIVDYLKEGKDCPALCIFKYEPPIKEVQDSKGRKHKYHQNPNFHIYHKFPNFKNVPHMFTSDDMVVVTRKIHGTNARYGIVKKSKITFWDKIKKLFGNKWIEYEYIYGSHNVEKGSDSQGFYSTDVWKTIAEKYDIKNKLWKVIKEYWEPKHLPYGVIIYGEIYGPGIQGSKYHYGLKDIAFVGFDATINNEYCDLVAEDLLFSLLDLPKVEKLYDGKFNLEIIKEFTCQNIPESNIPHEGVVVKHTDGSREKVAKFINPEYLIFSEKHLIPDSH